MQKFFSRYRPAGTIDIDLQASGNFEQLGQSVLSGKVYCKDVSMYDRKFPYLIEHIKGQIDFTEQRADLRNLSGRHDEVDVTISGWSAGFGPDWRYYILMTSDNMILDSDLYEALSNKRKKLWNAFSPSGLVAIDFRLSRSLPTAKKKTLVAELLDVDAKYSRFPYPLENLTGKLFLDPDTIVVRCRFE